MLNCLKPILDPIMMHPDNWETIDPHYYSTPPRSKELKKAMNAIKDEVFRPLRLALWATGGITQTLLTEFKHELMQKLSLGEC